MSKMNKIIAGLGVVAGLGVSMAPLSVFAEPIVTTQVQDTLQVTIEESITFGIDANGDGNYDGANDIYPVNHTNGTAIWEAGNNSHTVTDTLSKTMTGGDAEENFGTTALKVISNANGGYQIKATGTALSGTGSAAGKSIAKGTTIDGSVSNWAYKASVAGGSLALSGVTANTWTAAPDSATKIAGSNAISDATGDTLTVVYGVGVDNSQTAGTYSGTMTYTVSAAE